jgi:hypothetical protein
MWGASCLVALLLTPYWAYWFFNSPMMDLSHELSAVNPRIGRRAVFTTSGM